MQSRARPQTMNPRQSTGLLVVVCTSVLPALGLAGFLPGFRSLDVGFMIWLIVAIAGGAVGGILAARNLKYWYVAAIAGVLIGPGMLIATYYYTAARSFIFGLEIVIPMLLGALPGLIFLTLVTMLARKWRQSNLAR